MNDKLAFVSFEFRDGRIRPFLSMEGLSRLRGDPEQVLSKAAKAYESRVRTMRALRTRIEDARRSGQLVRARLVWRLGDAVYKLKEDLAHLSLELDGLYDHLQVALGVKPKWLQKVLSFRRHVPDEKLIPLSLSWGQCSRAPRRTAEQLTSRSIRR